jgi:hypothetical protein
VFSVFFVVAFSPAFSQTEIRWQVETSKNIPTPLDIRRGESVSLVPQFLSYSAVTNIGSNTTVELWYRSADISNGLYYAITGSVANATNGQARIPWTSANCAAATNYTYDLVLTSNSVINLRAFGTIRLLTGVYSQATTLTNPPTAWGLLDWSTISNRNTASAPFATPAQVSTSTVAAASWSANAASATNAHGSTNGFAVTGGPITQDGTNLLAQTIAGDLAGSNYTAAAALSGTNFTVAGDLAGSNYVQAAALSGSNYTAAAALSGTNFTVAGDLAGSNYVQTAALSGSNYTALAALSGTNFTIAGDLAGSNYVQTAALAGSNYVQTAALAGSNYTAATSLSGTNFTIAGDLAGSNYVQTAALAGSNYTAATSLSGTNFTVAGDLAGSNFTISASNSICRDVMPTSSVAYATDAGTAATADDFQSWLVSGGVETAGIRAGYQAIISAGILTTVYGPFAGEGAYGDALTAIGTAAGHGANGSTLTAIGNAAGYHATGDYNVAVGYYAGWQASTTNSVMIGSFAGHQSVGRSNIVIDALGAAPPAGGWTNAPVFYDGMRKVLNLGRVGETICLRGTTVGVVADASKKTNEIAGGWYSINSSVTSLLMRVDEQLVVTQLWAIADYPGACTATVFVSTYWSNAVIGYTVATNIPVSSTGSVVNCYVVVPADGGIWQSSGIGATSCTNATVGVRAVTP